MDKESALIARAQLELYANADGIAVVDGELQESLYGRLSTAGLTLSDLRYESASSACNTDLIRDFSGLLPHVKQDKSSRFYFEEDDLCQVRNITTSVVWYHCTKMEFESGEAFPFYVIGEKQIAKRKTELLLTPAVVNGGSSRYDGHIFTVGVNKGDWDNSLHLQSKISEDTYTKEDIKQLLMPRLGRLAITADTKGSTVADVQFRKNRRLGGLLLNILGVPYSPKASISVEEGDLRVCRTLEKLERGVADADLINYDVLGHLFRLACTFGKVVELGGLLDRHSTNELSPIEKIVQQDFE